MNEKQARFMRMVLAYKKGHSLSGLSEEGLDKVKAAAGSMTTKQAEEFSHVKKA